MSIEVRDKVGHATVEVYWNVEAEEPQLEMDVKVDSEVFPPLACLQSLANASRRMAEELDQKVAEMEQNSPAAVEREITDEEY